MKPPAIITCGFLCFLIGSTIMCTLLYKMDWYAEHVRNDLLMGIIVIVAILMLNIGIILISHKFNDNY